MTTWTDEYIYSRFYIAYEFLIVFLSRKLLFNSLLDYSLFFSCCYCCFCSTRIQFKAISVVPSSTEQIEDFDSLLSSNTVVRENHIKSQMVISPRLLYFIFELATVSNTLCSEVLKSIINKSLKSNGQLLDHVSKISSGHLLIAIQLVSL